MNLDHNKAPGFLIMGTPADLDAQARLGIVNLTPPPGAVRKIAVCCGASVWIGPRGHATLANIHLDPPPVVVCMECTAKFSKGNPVLSLGGTGAQFTFNDGTSIPPARN